MAKLEKEQLSTEINTSLGKADSASQPGHTHTASEVTDFDTEVANNSAVTANTAKVSYTDAAKVAGIEAGADVTDTANVTSAGALMDSEVDADIKTLTIAASSSISGDNTGDEPDSSVTVKGIVELATDAEFTTKTDETRYVNAKQVGSVTQTLTNKTLDDAKIIGAIFNLTGTSETLVIAHTSGHVTMNNAAANTLTVPPNSSVAFAVGTRLMVQQIGAGATTIAAGAGVTINAPTTVTLLIDEVDECRGLLKTATDVWELI